MTKIYDHDVIALGIDPGWASTGIAGVALIPEGVVSRGVRLVTTSDDRDRHERQAVADLRRLYAFVDAFTEVISRLKPQVLGVECYTVFDTTDARPEARALLNTIPQTAAATLAASQTDLVAVLAGIQQATGPLAEVTYEKTQRAGRGKAAKTLMVYTAAILAARQANVVVYPAMATDLKRRTGNPKASKSEVGAWVRAQVQRIDDALDARKIAKSNQEHVLDATGHAVLALEKFIAADDSQTQVTA